MWLPLFVLVLAPVISGIIQFTKTNEEIRAEEILKNANIQMEGHWLKLRQIFLSSSEPADKSHHLLEQSFDEYRGFTLGLAQNLSDLLSGYPHFQSEGVKRQVKLLSHLKISGLNDKDYRRSQELLEIMGNFSTKRNVCSYDDCKSVYPLLPSIQNFTSRSIDENELLYYWQEWRNVISKDARKAFLEYLNLYRKAASLNGHESASKTWYLDFEENNFLDELTSAMHELMPLYKEIHAYIRFLYNQNYSSDIIPEYGPIPDHFMEHIILHAWKGGGSFIVAPYRNNKLPDTKKKMTDERWTSLKALQMAAYFYESIGLQKLPYDFWNKYARLKTDQEAGPDCRAEVFSFPPNVGIKYCPRLEYKRFLQLHGNMAEIQYNLYRNRLPFGLNGEAFSGISSAIGEAVIVAASSHRHLESIHLMDRYDEKAAFNRLFRMGVHTLFTLPRYFVLEKFWVHALDHKEDVYPEKLNCAFWNIQLEYSGVSPPGDRTEEHFDPGYKFYRGIDDNSPLTSKILSELLGYQFYRALCLKSGWYIPGDPNYPLHNCDFYKSTEAGQLLSEMMALGSSKHWRDVIQIVTGERRISAKALLEYYEPLYTWLKARNAENGVSVGWSNDKTSC